MKEHSHNGLQNVRTFLLLATFMALFRGLSRLIPTTMILTEGHHYSSELPPPMQGASNALSPQTNCTVHVARNCTYGHTWSFLACLLNARNNSHNYVGQRYSLTIAYNRSVTIRGRKIADRGKPHDWIQSFLPNTSSIILEATNSGATIPSIDQEYFQQQQQQQEQNQPMRLVSDHVVLHVEEMQHFVELLSPSGQHNFSSMVSARIYSIVPSYTTRLTVLMESPTNQAHKDKTSQSRHSGEPSSQVLQKLRVAFPLANVSYVNRVMIDSDDNDRTNYLSSFPINVSDISLLICYTAGSFYCPLSALVLGDTLRSTIVLRGVDRETKSDVMQWLTNLTANDSYALPNLVRIDENKAQHHPTVSMQSRIGSWEYNETYGQEHFYFIDQNDPIWRIHDQYENKSLPTSYGSHVWKTCDKPLPFANLLGFCQAMHDYGRKTRLMVIGDSLQYMHLVSLLYSFGLPRDRMFIQRHLHPQKQMRALQPIECPNGLADIDIVFFRVNHAMPLSSISQRVVRGHPSNNVSYVTQSKSDRSEKSAMLLKERKDFMKDQLSRYYGQDLNFEEYYRCYSKRIDVLADINGYCPWHNEYLESKRDYTSIKKLANGSPPNTLIYIGVGAHFHHEGAFEESMLYFKHFIDRHVRPEDAVWFRTASVGHEGCGSATINRTFGEPYKSFSEYLKYGQSKKFDWDKFQKYNRIMEHLVWDHERRRQKEMLPELALVDIYWMTALRKDGHGSSVDCLHYLLPGIPDWWSHIFYSQLVEAAAAPAQ